MNPAWQIVVPLVN